MSLSCSFVHASVARRILRHESGANSFYMCHLPRIPVLILVMGGGRIRSHQILSSITCLISYFPLAAWPCSWLDLKLTYHPEQYRLICITKGLMSFPCAIVWCFYTEIKHKILKVPHQNQVDCWCSLLYYQLLNLGIKPCSNDWSSFNLWNHLFPIIDWANGLHANTLLDWLIIFVYSISIPLACQSSRPSLQSIHGVLDGKPHKWLTGSREFNLFSVLNLTYFC